MRTTTQERIEELRCYKKDYGNFNVPQRSKEYPGLGHWVANQRAAKRKGKLDPEVEAALDELGFVWER